MTAVAEQDAIENQLCVRIEELESEKEVLATQLDQAEEKLAHAIRPGMASVPREITAESGHKAALMGEFHETITDPCLECADAGADDDCQVCDGTGEVDRRVCVSWTTIKAIHRRVVEISEGGGV